MMTGVGAATSQTLAGYLATHFGSEFAFLTLSLLAVVALIAVACLVRETRPREE
jgi:fucose permease